jgi:uncharacterized protein (TIGR03083 family)
MQLTPRYGAVAIMEVDGEVGSALVRQRLRLQATLEGLTEEEWGTPSRCAGWRVQDVIAHLVDVNRFWSASITAGLSGTPTRLLTGFDPATSPAQLVLAQGTQAPPDVLERFTRTTRSLATLVDDLDDDGWAAVAETPVGHVTIRTLAHHALWDAWVHERDIHLPLDRPVVEEPDELLACVRFAAALSPAFALSAGRPSPDRVVHVEDLGQTFVVTVSDQVRVRTGEGTPDLRGGAVELIEVLSVRSEPDPADRWMVEGLEEAFARSEPPMS